MNDEKYLLICQIAESTPDQAMETKYKHLPLDSIPPYILRKWLIWNASRYINKITKKISIINIK